jgi:sulfur carrier protein
MTVLINGEPVEMFGSASVADVLRRIDVDVNAAGVAVARNGEVVPRSAWTTIEVASGDRIEVLYPVQGG